MAASTPRRWDTGTTLLPVGTSAVRVRTRGSGPPVICAELPLNGLARLAALQDALAQSHTVHLLDFRPALGTPSRPAPGDLLSHVAALTLEAMDALGIDECAMLGTFMFAAVAMHLGSLVPSRVTRLVLLGSLGTQRLPATFWMRATTGVFRLPGFPAAHRLSPVRHAVEAVDRAWFGPRRMRELFRDPDTAPLRLDDLYEQNRRPEVAEAAFTLMWCIREMHCERMAARASAVHRPTLLIHGDDDVWVPIASARALAARIPGARLVAIPGARHAPELDRPDETRALIAAELAGRAPGAR